ncbi:lactate utilization protein C [Myceligenerans crystallogenes]|uniref:LUD domain-containing protein n=1 Tax=Myceligenerans crystallogenes TaxID=316335 RepID=A0ABN2N200_9MICO
MTDARTEVLNRIREALGSGSPATQGPVPRGYRSAGQWEPGSAGALELLVDRLADYKARVHRVAGDEIAATVARLVTELPLAGDAAETGSRGDVSAVVVPHGLDAAWLAGLPAGVQVVTDAPGQPLPASDLERTDVVVTAARVAIAETGTIVLDGEPGQGRRAISLVPDVHVCVIRADQVVQTVPEAVRLLAGHPARPLTWISGPSATSDIELDRVEGVHGPRTLHVVLVS